MIQDATNQQIKMLNTHCPLAGKTVLEIGCGTGRISRDLARHAARVLASDPDAAAIAAARVKSQATNVTFIHSPEGIPPLAKGAFDLVIYTLSLHHVPKQEMHSNLQRAGELLKPAGEILVLEPAAGGSFNEAKSRFGIGSGDERPLIAAALHALRTLPGWHLSGIENFMTEFWFENQDDFYTSKLPSFNELSNARQAEIASFLQQHSAGRKIVLTSERSLYRLSPVNKEQQSGV